MGRVVMLCEQYGLGLSNIQNPIINHMRRAIDIMVVF